MKSLQKEKEKIDKAVEWYNKNRILYERLAMKVETLLKEILDAEKIVYHDVSSRAKELKSFEDKAGKYKDPINDIKDLAGLRITTYVESDVVRIGQLIEREFKVGYDHLSDKSNNKFGYRSVHYIACLNDIRSQLAELRIFKDIYFEIQVRTILQHAWAEIEHDRGYKFQGVLPEHDDIKNRFAVIAGILKMADSEFDAIVKDLEGYAENVEHQTKSGELDIPIDSISLREYMNTKFNDQVTAGGLQADFGLKDQGLSEIIDELSSFGIATLAQLDNVIPSNFSTKAVVELRSGANFISVLRTIMMITDIEKYFSSAWNEHWRGLDKHTITTLRKYNVPYGPYIDKYDLITDYEDYLQYHELDEEDDRIT